MSQNYYTQFKNRKQKFGDFATFGSDLEMLSRLAYPECPYVGDKIACAQFVSVISEGFVKRTLQLEGITLKSVVERAKIIKIIQGENFGGRNNFDRRTNREEIERNRKERE